MRLTNRIFNKKQTKKQDGNDVLFLILLMKVIRAVFLICFVPSIKSYKAVPD